MAKARPLKRKNKPGAGRKFEGRVRKHVSMTLDAWSELEARKKGRGDTPGKVFERLLGVAT